jgi:RimJ/RimL family protein N-acetyltransferase
VKSVRNEINDPAAFSHGRHRSYGIGAGSEMPRFMPPYLTEGAVLLRAWRNDDADALVRRINDPDVARFLEMVPQPYAIDDARAFLGQCAESWRNGGGRRGGRLLGGSRGARTRCRYSRSTPGDEVGVRGGVGVGEARTSRSGRQSRLNRFAEKSGFTRERVLRAQRFNARLGRRVDFVMWSILREEL